MAVQASAKQELAKISEKLSSLALVGQASGYQPEQLFLELLQNPVSGYFSTDFEKGQLEQVIEQQLADIRQSLKADGVTQKYLTASFMDLIKMVQAMRGMSQKEQARQLKSFGIEHQLDAIMTTLAELHGSKQDQRMQQMLKSIHYGQLLNFDYKFQITTADSMIQGNGKCSIHLKMEVLNARNQKEQHYCELTLDQFYTLFHELKRAYSLMEVL